MPVSQQLPDGPYTPGAGTPGADMQAVVAFLAQKGTATDAELQADTATKVTGDGITIELLADQATYEAIAAPDGQTLYFVPEPQV